MKYKHRTETQISDKSRKHAKKLSEKNDFYDLKDLKVFNQLGLVMSRNTPGVMPNDSCIFLFKVLTVLNPAS